MWGYASGLFDKMRSWQDVADILNYVLKIAVSVLGSVAIWLVVVMAIILAIGLYHCVLSLIWDLTRGKMPTRKSQENAFHVGQIQGIIHEAEKSRHLSHSEFRHSIEAVGRIASKIKFDE